MRCEYCKSAQHNKREVLDGHIEYTYTIHAYYNITNTQHSTIPAQYVI